MSFLTLFTLVPFYVMLTRAVKPLGDDGTGDLGALFRVALQYYSTRINVYGNQVMAASLVVSVPVVVGFLLLQRYLVAGLTSGAVK